MSPIFERGPYREITKLALGLMVSGHTLSDEVYERGCATTDKGAEYRGGRNIQNNLGYR
jgi:hypothetical protein